MDNIVLKRDPWIALGLSFLITGAGQLYQGETKKAVVFFLLACFLGGLGATVSPAFFTLLVILWLINMADAFHQGEPVPASLGGSRRSDIIRVFGTIQDLENAGALSKEEAHQTRLTAIEDSERPGDIEARLAVVGRAYEAVRRGTIRREDAELIKENMG